MRALLLGLLLIAHIAVRVLAGGADPTLLPVAAVRKTRDSRVPSMTRTVKTRPAQRAPSETFISPASTPAPMIRVPAPVVRALGIGPTAKA